ncbi:MAG TPA: DUF2231 domain-containing protein [Noviherbaspirillum sp.]|nr:DUF2231 domain-containing protein [Noviherbaspirillum sp.]
MSIRIHEVHPTLAHFPLALLPVAFLADLAGRLTGRISLMRIGRFLMPAAAASGAATAVAGLAAQEAVEPGDAHDLLITHRNLNAGLVAAVGALALLRARKEAPGTGYLVASAAALGGMFYTAYLGGLMVYRHGVGVAPAKGVREQSSPEIRYAAAREIAHVAADNVGHAVTDAVHHLREGKVAPALRQ